MPRIHNPKKTLSVWHLKGQPGLRRACRYYVFALAEELYPERFAELKERALPLYRAIEEHQPPVVIDGQIVENCPLLVQALGFGPPPERSTEDDLTPAVKLEMVITEWCDELGLVASSDPERTAWLRELAHDRIRAWYDGDGEPNKAALFIGGISLRSEEDGHYSPDLEPQRKGETPEAYKKRQDRVRAEWFERRIEARAKKAMGLQIFTGINPEDSWDFPQWTRTLFTARVGKDGKQNAKNRDTDFFEWFVHRRVGKVLLKQSAFDTVKRRKRTKSPVSVAAVASGIAVIATIVDPD